MGRKKSRRKTKTNSAKSIQRKSASSSEKNSKYYGYFGLVLSCVACIISLLSIAVAVNSNKISKEANIANGIIAQTNIRPYIAVETMREASTSKIYFRNYGQGPGVLASLNVRWEGKYMTGFKDLERELGISLRTSKITIGNFGVGSVLGAGNEDFIFLKVVDDNNAQNVLFRNQKYLSFEICYCSLFGECWIAKNYEPFPDKVEECPTQKFAIEDSY